MAFEILLLLSVLHFTVATVFPLGNEPRNYTYDIRFDVYHGVSSFDYRSVALAESLNASLFIPANDVTFFIADWSTDEINIGEDVTTLSLAYVRRQNITFTLIDISMILNQGNLFGNALTTYNRIMNIANTLAQFFHRFIPRIKTIDRIHFICHGAGCLVLSQLARSYGTGEFRWLTGLDPANILTEPLIAPLNSRDGRFVDIIHTDDNGFGNSYASGTTNFFPNGGYHPQPACLHDINVDCSHRIALSYYAESVMYPYSFPARRCSRVPICTTFLQFCPCFAGSPLVNMGIDVNRNASGDFFLKTNSRRPYAQGLSGAQIGLPPFVI